MDDFFECEQGCNCPCHEGCPCYGDCDYCANRGSELCENCDYYDVD